jgi:hypothetical protein
MYAFEKMNNDSPGASRTFAKSRNGTANIRCTITWLINFDPPKNYPIIKSICTGSRDSFVLKTFNVIAHDQALAELGFIVVHIHGEGTSNRSKLFHDVTSKNLCDAVFSCRDISRMDFFGASAGGQNFPEDILFHPEFYKIVVTNNGCHENCMDEIWWNERSMSWPLDSQYAASSNVESGYRLQGKAFIVTGEMDSNVNPASSLQVVTALVKTHKHFNKLFIPGQNYGVGILADEHYRDDPFVHNFFSVELSNWNKVSLSANEPLEN